MAKEVGLKIERSSFHWMHPKKVSRYGLKKLDDDNDTIEMSLFVDESRIMHIYCRYEGTLNEKLDEEADIVERVNSADLEASDKNPEDEEKSDSGSSFHDSDYELMEDEDDEMFEKFVDIGIKRDMNGAENEIM